MKDTNLLDLDFLPELCQTYGPSGEEEDVYKLTLAATKDFIDDAKVDTIGNLILRKKGSGRKIMVSAHMDEVGVIITYIDKQGYLSFSVVGGLIQSDLIHKRVVFRNRRVGVVNKVPLNDREGQEINQYYIDVGVYSEEEARLLVKEGDMAVLEGLYYDNGTNIISKALNNRAGCLLAIEAIKKINCEHDLTFVFTSQNAVGNRGAKVAAYQVEADFALVVDATTCIDERKQKNQIAMNRGVAIKVMDKSIIVNPSIKNWMIDVARSKNIPFQLEISDTVGTDAGPIHLTKGGIATGGISFPIRYLHTGNEMVSKQDLQAAFHLISELIKNPYVITKK